MHLCFCKAIEELSISNQVYKLIHQNEYVNVQQISDEYMKIHNSNYSMYFKNNKLALFLKHDEVNEVFFNENDAINILFTPTNL